MSQTEFRTGVLRPVEIYKEAWAIIRDQYWMIFAVTIVGLLIGSTIPVILVGPMVCGIYLVLFDRIAGRPIDFARLFKGFDYFIPGLIVALIITVPVIVLIVAMYVPMIFMAMAGPRMSEGELFAAIAGILAVELVVALVMVCLHTLLLFSFPLIVDRKLSAVDSIKVSARAVWGNLGGVAGLFGVSILVTMAGYLALCIGVYLAVPLIFAANAVAYRKIFPAEPEFGV